MGEWLIRLSADAKLTVRSLKIVKKVRWVSG